MFLIAIVVIAGYVVYAMSPEERARLIEAVRGMVETGWDAYSRQRGRPDAFRDALTARTRVPYVTLAVVLLLSLIHI